MSDASIFQILFPNQLIMPLAKDLLHPSLDEERRKHKKKRLVQSPNSFFMDVKCPGCYKITTGKLHTNRLALLLIGPSRSQSSATLKRSFSVLAAITCSARHQGAKLVWRKVVHFARNATHPWHARTIMNEIKRHLTKRRETEDHRQ